MDASLETLVTAAYVFACSLSIPRCGPRGKATDQELIALAVAQAVTGLVSDRQFLGTIGRLLPGCFPELPGQSLVQSPPAAPHAADHARAARRRRAGCPRPRAPRRRHPALLRELRRLRQQERV